MKNNYIESLGIEKIKIDVSCNKNCYFYILTKKISESIISNDDYFILDLNERYYKKESFELKDKSIIVTFDKELILNNEVIKGKKKKVDDFIIKDFLYSITYYYIKNEDYENAKVTLSNTKDINAYITFINNYEISEPILIKEEFEDLLKDKKKRFENGEAKIRVSKPVLNKIYLIDLLEEILEDKSSTLLWDYNDDYRRIGIKNNNLDKNLTFNRLENTFGQVTKLLLGNKKINIGIKVKILGQVENLNNNLKLDAAIYREYNLICNGEVNNEFIWCTLSKALKNKLSKMKIIKSVTNIKYNNSQVYIIDISKIPIINKNFLNTITTEEIAKTLYTISELNCKISILNKEIEKLLDNSNKKNIQDDLNEKDINDYLNKNDINENELKNTFSKEQLEIRKSFNINSKGIYNSEDREKNNFNEIYIGDIIYWTIDKFPKKKVEDKYLKEVSELIDKELLNTNLNLIYKTLNNHLKSVKALKEVNENIINKLRIISYIYNIDLFEWDSEEFKSKNIFDKELNLNSIVGQRVKINKVKINDITIKQYYYKEVIKAFNNQY